MSGAGASVRIGTSGWSYPHWRGAFYPKNLPEGQWLSWYARRFSAVEINNTFYHLPAPGTLRACRDATPEDFVFTVKASRYITHMKKLKDPREPLERFLDSLAPLGHKLAAVLFQLPPNWRVDRARLEAFVALLGDGPRCVFEFRHESGFDPAICELLEAHGCAFCIYDIAGRQSPKRVTGGLAYVRLHGPAGTAYQGSYDRQTLAGWAGAFSSWRAAGKDVFCFFDNDEKGYAAADAQALSAMLA